MKPSETQSGRAWLENFAPADIPPATMLLASLRVVGLSRMHNRLTARLRELGEGSQIESPVLVIPERSLADFGLTVKQRASAVAYQDFSPGAPLDVTPGSEAFVAGILRDFVGGRRFAMSAGWIRPDATLEDLRNRRCRSIVLTTDYIGSGTQISNLAEAFRRNPTIRSWRSLHLIKIHALAFAAEPDAMGRLASSKAIDCVWTVEAAPTFATAAWTADALGLIEELCIRESRMGRRYALGYADSRGLFASQRGAPNSLPAVFWQTTAAWEPLFPQRTVTPEFSRELSGYRPSEPLADLAVRVGQLRIGRNERVDHMRPRSRSLLRALLLAGRQATRADRLAAELGVDMATAEALVGALLRLGLVDSGGRITAAGRSELEAGKRARRRTTSGLVGSDAVYYPQSLK